MDKDRIEKELENLKKDIAITKNRLENFDKECKIIKSEMCKMDANFLWKNKTETIIARIEKLENVCIGLFDELGEIKKEMKCIIAFY